MVADLKTILKWLLIETEGNWLIKIGADLKMVADRNLRNYAMQPFKLKIWTFRNTKIKLCDVVF